MRPGGGTTGYRSKSLRDGPNHPGKTGRPLLNETRGLEGGSSPAPARIVCRAAITVPSFAQGAADFAEPAAIHVSIQGC